MSIWKARSSVANNRKKIDTWKYRPKGATQDIPIQIYMLRNHSIGYEEIRFEIVARSTDPVILVQKSGKDLDVLRREVKQELDDKFSLVWSRYLLLSLGGHYTHWQELGDGGGCHGLPAGDSGPTILAAIQDSFADREIHGDLSFKFQFKEIEVATNAEGKQCFRNVNSTYLHRIWRSLPNFFQQVRRSRYCGHGALFGGEQAGYPDAAVRFHAAADSLGGSSAQGPAAGYVAGHS